MNIDESKEEFDKLTKLWLKEDRETLTEQDTRFRLIDLILVTVLGWNRNEIKTESHVESGYIDYLIESNGKNKFVIEAKKASRILIDTLNPKMRDYKLNGPALKSARDGIIQATSYCVDTGVSFAALTTGYEWIGFMATRKDGKSPGEGKAIVFPNLQCINDNFAVFYDLFSKEGILNQLNKVRINEAEGLQVSHVIELHQVIDKTKIYMLKKSKLALDMDRIFTEF
jgi:predicted type IV restriction endonuclease